MEKSKKAGIVGLWAYFIISTLITFNEYQNIVAGRDLYLATKILLQIWLLGLCFWYPRNPYGQGPNLWVGIHIIVSNIHGQYFSPWYVFSFIEMILAFSFLYPLPRKSYNILLITGTTAFTGVALLRYEEVYKWLYNSQRADLAVSIVTAAVVAWLCHNFFTADRTYYKDLLRKYGLIGYQTANIVHDLKGMLAAPKLYTELIKKKVDREDMELQALVENLERQLAGINRAVTGLNQVVALQDQTKETFTIREVVDEVAETLGVLKRNIELEIKGDLVLVSEKALFKSIFYNLMMNSIQAFRKNKVAKAKICVTCEAEGLVVSDNAGGFSEEILKSVEDFRFDAFDGTGMGLFLVVNGVQTLGGKVHFSNGAEGARIRLMLPSNSSTFCGRFRQLASFGDLKARLGRKFY